MLAILKRLLAAPTFEGDEDKTRTAKLLNVVLITSLAVLVLSGTGLPFTGSFFKGAAHTTIKLKVEKDQAVPNE